ncbi:MAG: serine protease, partial [Phycisphaerae bacterium]
TKHSEGTAEHNPAIEVTLPDRTVLKAKLVASDSDFDIALLQSERTEEARISEAAVISSGTGPRIGDVVLAAGFPGRETFGSSVVRIGSVMDADEEQFRSGCMLTSGDSGGAVVDSSGAVIGLNRRIGINADQNFHIPLRRIQTFLK